MLFAATSNSWLREIEDWWWHDSSIFTQTATGEWRDAQTRVQFKLTEGWSIRRAGRWGKGETTTRFKDANARDTNAALYYRVERRATQRTAEQAEASLLKELQFKVAQRRRQGLPDYQPRPYRRYQVAGHEAISWVADFTVGGKPMVEVCTLIQSERVTALFFSKLPAAGLKDFRERFGHTEASLRIP